MTNRVRLVAGTLVVVCAAGGLANAQTRAGDPLRFSIAAGVEWTDNRDATSEEKESTHLFLAPRIDVMATTERFVLDLYYAPLFLYRTNPSDWQNDFDLLNDLGLDVTWKVIPRLSLIAKEAFRTSYDPEVEDGGTRVRRDSSYVRNHLEGGVAIQATRNTSVDVRGRHVIKAYKVNEVADVSDESSLGASATFWWQMLRTFGVLGSVDVGSQDFSEGDYAVDRDFSVVAAGIGLEKSFSRDLRLSARAGVRMMDYGDGTIDSDTTPYARISFGGEVSRYFEASASAAYETRTADDYPFSSQQYIGLGARIAWNVVLERLTLALAGDYRVAHYEADKVPAGFATQEAMDAAWQAFAAREGIDVRSDGDKVVQTVLAEVVYAFGTVNKLRFAQRYEDVQSDVSEDFQRNSSTLSYQRDF